MFQFYNKFFKIGKTEQLIKYTRRNFQSFAGVVETKYNFNRITLNLNHSSSNFQTLLKYSISNANAKKLSTNTSNINQVKIEELSIPVPWGSVRGQIFGNPASAKPMLCLHGHLDNSNSFKPLAQFLTSTNEFYLISLDSPGHGQSSKLPDGIPYTPKLLISAIRRVVRHLNLNKFYFLCHSYGVGLSLMYQTIFKDEVIATIGIDWIYSYTPEKWENMTKIWKDGIDSYIDEEMGVKKEKKNKNERKELTKELALDLLLKANSHLDKESAKILLERALVTDERGKLNFSRDVRLKNMVNGDHFSEFTHLLPFINKSLTSPVLMIRAVKPSYGTAFSEITLKNIKAMNTNSNIELTTIDSTHHLHMLKAEACAEKIFEFLRKKVK